MAIIKLHGALREESRIKELEIREGYITEILDNLPEEIKKVLRKYSKHLLILVNGNRVYDLRDVFVSYNDVVDITLPVGGG